MVIYLVTYEERDELGRISETVAMAFLNEELAEQFCAEFNEDPATSPRSAEVHPVAVLTQMPTTKQTRPKSDTGREQKLTSDDAMQIRKRYDRGVKVGVLAEDFGVSRASVYDVVSGRTWGWL